MQQDASSQRKIPVQQRSVYQVVLLLVFILFTNAVLLPSLKLLSSSSSLTVSEVLGKSMPGYMRSLRVYNQHWFCLA